MKCEHARTQLTAYLDGELDADRGSAVRGHLRTCDDCRRIAGDEAALRDGLRALPTVDPPNTMWSGIQARLAQAEMADAEKPRWRLALARWFRPIATPRYAVATAALAVAVIAIAWRATHRGQAEVPVVASSGGGSQVAPAPHDPVQPAPVAPAPSALADRDVSEDIATEPARVAQEYAATADALLVDAKAARDTWTEERKRTFDAHVTELRQQIARAQGRAQHKLYRDLIRYLQRAAVMDEVAMADIGGGR